MTIGLSGHYRDKTKPTKQLIRSLFTLPLLPLREMKSEFLRLKIKFDQNCEKMQNLYTYVAQTWFSSSVWEPRNICAYKRLVRTNNDAEGYHRRMSSRLGENPAIYTLLEWLHTEARLVDVTCKILTAKNVKMVRRQQTRNAQALLTELWKQYENGDIDSTQLLEEAVKFSPSFL